MRDDIRAVIRSMDMQLLSLSSIIEINKDSKSKTWIITKTDSEGFHHQINVTIEELFELGKACFRMLDKEPEI